jgi:transposase-like protein
VSADALGGVHLLPAGEAFERGYPNTRLAVCGEPVTSAPDGDEVDPGYCADCLSTAIRWRQRVSAEVDPCPSCGGTSDLPIITGTAPTVQGWKCGACGTDWAVTVVNSRSYLDYLAATVELADVRSALRALLSLVDDARRSPMRNCVPG